MKLLFLANRIPYPPYRGDKLKIYNLAKRLALKHELYLLTFTEIASDLQYMSELKLIFKEVHLVHLPKWKSLIQCLKNFGTNLPFQVAYFQSNELNVKLNELLNNHQFESIHIQHLRMAPYLLQHKELHRILDLPDAYSLYWERRKKIRRGFFKSLFENEEQRRILKFEKEVLKAFQKVLLCSSEDLEYLQTKHNTYNLGLLPNGVDSEVFSSKNHDYTHNHTLLFTGNMDYEPNVDAVIYFTKEILPLIHIKYPDVVFIIAGQRPIAKVIELVNDKVKVTGFINNLTNVYNDASVVVAPLRFGAGTQNKVLEAMSVGVPVVCSNIGFKGLGIENGEGAIMQTDATNFANSVCELLASTSLRMQVGKKGKEVIKTKFDWDVIATQLEQYFMHENG